MKAYIIYNPEVKESLALATNCLKSCSEVNQKAWLTPGVKKSEAYDVAKKEGFDNFIWEENGRKKMLRDGQVGCIMSHYFLWKRCAALGVPIIVLEHDAEFIKELVDIPFDEVMTLQRYVWDDPTFPFSQKLNALYAYPHPNGNAKYVCLPGTCGYAITPEGANKLLVAMKEKGLAPADVYTNKNVVKIDEHPDLPIMVHNDFSTVAPNSVDF